MAYKNRRRGKKLWFNGKICNQQVWQRIGAKLQKNMRKISESVLLLPFVAVAREPAKPAA